MAPAVRSILSAARSRGGDHERLSVDPRPFGEALATARADDRRPVIAEIKPTSPTSDGERTEDPVDLARQMVDGGAAALSVLTEPTHFGGSPDALRRVRESVDVPVLRKDFLLHEAQLDTVETDVVLLVVRFLDDLESMLTAAESRGFQALVEVHTRTELREAVAAGASIVGVNNRDLAELSLDLSTFEHVAPIAPPEVTLIAESGITTPTEADRMLAAGADGLLVGSAIMDHGEGSDVAANTRTLTYE